MPCKSRKLLYEAGPFDNTLHSGMKTGFFINLIFIYYMSLHNWSFTQWPWTQSCLQTILVMWWQRELESSRTQLCISSEYRCNLQWINSHSKLVSLWVQAKQRFCEGAAEGSLQALRWKRRSQLILGAKPCMGREDLTRGTAERGCQRQREPRGLRLPVRAG